MVEEEELLYRIALTFVPGAGNITAKKLAVYCGSAKAVFTGPAKTLLSIPGINKTLAANLRDKSIIDRAQQELNFIRKHNVSCLFFTDKDYPDRLREIDDAPVMLYFRGNASLQMKRAVAVVGTRKATRYGIDNTEKLIEGLVSSGVTIVSGLAYGIDIAAHRASLKAGVPTIGIPGHGLDRMYPSGHASTARRMIENGGVLTEFPSGTNPDAQNFPKRNRIIAALCDAVIIMEARETGGALITGKLAAGYHRDVFAYPGRAGDESSSGCNMMIKNNLAALVENAEDVIRNMNWDVAELKQQQLPIELPDLTEEETVIVNVLKNKGKTPIDLICHDTSIPVSKAAGILLNLEFEGLVKTLPGKMYELAR